MTVVDDIRTGWLSVARRMQSVAKSEGLSVVTINVLVDAEGNPQAWTSPKQTKIEPKGAASALLALFVESDGS